MAVLVQLQVPVLLALVQLDIPEQIVKSRLVQQIHAKMMVLAPSMVPVTHVHVQRVTRELIVR